VTTGEILIIALYVEAALYMIHFFRAGERRQMRLFRTGGRDN